MLRLAATLFAFLLLSGAAEAQWVPAARADGAGHHELWVAPADGGPGVLVAAGLDFAPLQLADHAVADRLRPDRPQPAAAPPAPHVLLAEGGSLYLVRGQAFTALLHVRPDGSLGVPLLLPETGGPALAGLLAKADGAPLVLLASAPSAGGQAWLASLAGGPPRLLSPAGASAVDPGSLRVSATRAFFVAGGVLHAADVGSAAPAAPVPLGAPGDVVLPELVLSGDGRSLAAVTQAPGGLRLVHVVDESLVAWQITAAPGAYDTPNLASPFGPWLALSADGSRVAWRATIGPASEVFLRDVPQPAAAVQVTADASFVDTIDNVGVLGFTAFGKLRFAAGEVQVGGAPGQIGSADLFTAQAPAGGAIAITNVTQTSGDTVAPFDVPGELEIIDQLADPTGLKLLLVVDPNGADAALLAMPADGSAPATALLPALDVAPELHAAGDSVLVVSQTCSSCPRQLRLLHPNGALQLLGALPAGLVLDRFAAGGGHAAFVASAGTLELAVRVVLASGAVELPWPLLGTVSGAITLAPGSGALRLGAGGPAGPPHLLLQLDGVLAGKALGIPPGEIVPLDT